MFDGKNKAITFSYDDGVSQDLRLIELFNKYGIKATFNINSGLMGKRGSLVREGKSVLFNRLTADEVKEVYKGHEVAVHTLTHPLLQGIYNEGEIIRQVEEDRKNLSEIVGYEVVGMAYPCNGDRCERVARILKNSTGVKYSRTTTSTYNFDLQSELLMFNPTIHHHNEFERLFRAGEEFLKLKTLEPKLFYIWGHSFEFDIYDDWGRMDEFLAMMSGRDEIFYGTNKEVFLG